MIRPLLVIGRHSPWLGRLPGDIHYQGQNVANTQTQRL
ncbi:MAG: DUF2905 domain-containing protein [Ardenticatenia bacterium]|nr:DUF2905 domain-containing protein [Ardenticatenia bacterium]